MHPFVVLVSLAAGVFAGSFVKEQIDDELDAKKRNKFETLHDIMRTAEYEGFHEVEAAASRTLQNLNKENDE